MLEHCDELLRAMEMTSCLLRRRQVRPGRVFALQAIAAYRDEGAPGGVARSYGLLRKAAERETRSHIDAGQLCATNRGSLGLRLSEASASCRK